MKCINYLLTWVANSMCNVCTVGPGYSEPILFCIYIHICCFVDAEVIFGRVPSLICVLMFFHQMEGPTIYTKPPPNS